MKITKSKEEIAKQLGGNLVYGLGLELEAGEQQVPIVNEEGELTGFDKEMNIPSTITKIAADAFASKEISKVNLSEGLLEIGAGAFYDNKLKNLVVPSTVTNLGYKEGFDPNTDNGVFQGNLLTNIDLGRVKTIGQQSLAINQLTEVVIPDSVTTIGNVAFYQNQLTNVVIPDSVTTIGNEAFGNNLLTNVVIPDSVTTIGNTAFAGNQLTEVVIPDSVTTIGDGAFGNNLLTNVVIPDSVTTIGIGAFTDNLLTTVSVPFGKATEWENAFDQGVVLTERPDPNA